MCLKMQEHGCVVSLYLCLSVCVCVSVYALKFGHVCLTALSSVFVSLVPDLLSSSLFYYLSVLTCISPIHSLSLPFSLSPGALSGLLQLPVQCSPLQPAAGPQQGRRGGQHAGPALQPTGESLLCSLLSVTLLPLVSGGFLLVRIQKDDTTQKITKANNRQHAASDQAWFSQFSSLPISLMISHAPEAESTDVDQCICMHQRGLQPTEPMVLMTLTRHSELQHYYKQNVLSPPPSCRSSKASF